MPAQDDWKASLLANWNAILGNLNGKVRLEKIEEDTLTLGVYDACWMQELYLLTPLLINTINKSLDQPRIKNLRFKRSGTAKKNVAVRTPEKKALRAVTLSEKERDALKNIKDSQLSSALEQFLIRCYQEKV